ncbi:MAG: hypothetical protein IPK83_22420 [Planctomycetes bacterium]|nr:hypothetical protein [Planctomycetota bacterium]
MNDTNGACPSFNDDIQGTSAVAVAGMINALRITRAPIREQRILYVGAGAAGIGIAHLMRMYMSANKVEAETLRRSCLFFDTQGVVHATRQGLSDAKREFAADAQTLAQYGIDDPRGMSLHQVVSHFRPTMLIGTSTQPGIFTEEVIREMARHVDQPVIFAFSNPTSKSECKPEDAIRWTRGRALVATGSPFPLSHSKKSPTSLDREIMSSSSPDWAWGRLYPRHMRLMMPCC